MPMRSCSFAMAVRRLIVHYGEVSRAGSGRTRSCSAATSSSPIVCSKRDFHARVPPHARSGRCFREGGSTAAGDDNRQQIGERARARARTHACQTGSTIRFAFASAARRRSRSSYAGAFARPALSCPASLTRVKALVHHLCRTSVPPYLRSTSSSAISPSASPSRALAPLVRAIRSGIGCCVS